MHPILQLGEEENNKISSQDALLLRLMMPVAKAYTAKKAVSNISEGLECFGGQGYIEDTGLPGMLRDVQVLPIWEGTTNVMALDTARAIAKSKGKVMQAFHERISNAIHAGLESNDAEIQRSTARLKMDMDAFTHFCSDQGEIFRNFGFNLV